jgi:hypothetical protein
MSAMHTQIASDIQIASHQSRKVIALGGEADIQDENESGHFEVSLVAVEVS